MNHKSFSGYDVGEVCNEFSKFMFKLSREGIKDEDVTVICKDKDLRYIEYDIYW